jgi:hypothetical protein
MSPEHRRDATRGPKPSGRAVEPGAAPDVHPLIQLQHTIGNEAVARLVQGRERSGTAGARTLARTVADTLDYNRLADRIHSAIEGWGTDEEAVYSALQMCQGDSTAIAELKSRYLTRHGETLEDAIRGDFSGTELEYALQLINAGTPGSAQAIGGIPANAAQWKAAAARIRDAVEGWGTDEEAIYAVLRPLNRDPNLIDTLGTTYFVEYGENMIDRIKDELSEEELDYALYLLRLRGSPGQEAVATEAAGMVGSTMTWFPSGPGPGTDFATWASAPTETAAPPVATVTTINCWEMILLAAYNRGMITWKWVHDLYVSAAAGWDARMVEAMSGGARVRYTGAAGPTPLRGDIVFMDGIAHVALATGTRDSTGRCEVISFWPPPGHSSIPGTVDAVKVTTIEELADWWTSVAAWPAPTVEFAGAPW